MLKRKDFLLRRNIAMHPLNNKWNIIEVTTNNLRINHIETIRTQTDFLCWIHLIGCSVLMITNLIDNPKRYLYLSMLTKQALQTGSIVDCTNWLHMRTGERNKIKALTLIADIDCEQDQLFRGIKWLISKTVLDQGTKVIWRTTRARMMINTCWF